MDFILRNLPSQEEKIVIVTGANNGIGFETTIGMVRTGATVIMACRNMEKAQKAKSEILNQHPQAKLDIIPLDLSDVNSVRKFANEFRATYSKLDIIINNAGVLSYSGKKNKDGIELQFATNHLGHFLLTSLLLDLMPDNKYSRIISLSSVAHKGAKIHFDDINCEIAEDKGAAYGQSKLACLMFGDELNRRLVKAGKNIKSLSVHPGGSDSGLFDEMSSVQYFILKILAPLITHSNASAAKPALFAALSPDVQGGDYYGPTGFNDLKGKLGFAKRTDYSKNSTVAARLWTLSEEMLNINFKI